MVTTILLVKQGSYVGFHTVGHAGEAIKALPGQDLVCAAVSVLTQNTANSLEFFLGEACVSVVVNDGDLKVILIDPLPDGGHHDAQVILQTLNLGLKDLEDTYPKYLRLQMEEVD